MAENRINKDDIIDLSGLMKDIGRAISLLEKLSKTLREDLVAGATAAKEALKATDATTKKGQTTIKKSVQLATTLTAEQKKLIESQVKLNHAKKEYRKQAELDIKALKSQKGSINALKAEINRLEVQYAKMGKGATGAAQKIRNLKRQLREQQNATKDTTSFTKKMTSSFRNAGKQLLIMTGLSGGVTVALNRLRTALNKAVKDFAEFETGQKNVQSLLNEFDATLSRRTTALMKEYGLTVEETNKALFDAVSAGISAADATEFLGTAAKLSIAGVTDLATATDGITTILNAYRLETSEANNIVDAFFSAQKFGKTTVEELSVSIGKVAPIAKAAGVSYQELLSTFALLTKNGIATEETATAIRATITALINPGEEAAKAMEEYGIETGVAAIKNNGLFNTLKKVALVTEMNEDALTEFIPNVRALVGVASLSTEALLEYDTILQTVTEDTGDASSATKAFQDQMSSFRKESDLVNQELNEQVRLVGKNLAPGWLLGKKGLLQYIKTERKLLATFISPKLFGERKDNIEEIDEATEKWGETVARVIREADARKAAEEEKKKIAERVAAAEKAAMIQAEIDKRVAAATAYREKVSQEERIRLSEETQDAIKDVRVEGTREINSTELAETKQSNRDIEAEERAHAEVLKSIDKEVADEKNAGRLEGLQQGIEIAQQTANALADIFEAQKQRELSAVGDNAAAREAIERKYRKKQQSLSISQALLNGALGITKTFAEYGYTPAGIIAAALLTASTAAQVATIASQKFAHGGFGVLGGDVHASGGVAIPGIGEAEKGEAFGIISRRATANYGAKTLERVFDSIENGTFHNVWGKANAQLINVNVEHDPYTKKMYEYMTKTPVSYVDSNGDTVLFVHGEKFVIKRN